MFEITPAEVLEKPF